MSQAVADNHKTLRDGWNDYSKITDIASLEARVQSIIMYTIRWGSAPTGRFWFRRHEACREIKIKDIN